MGRFIDLTGQTFGRLTAEKRVGTTSNGGTAIWQCRCACGNTAEVTSSHLRQRPSEVKSCGCHKPHRSHGHTTRGKVTAEYRAWTDAKSRCFNPNVWSWPLYGGRGISMAPEWVDSFEAFLQYIGPKPGPKHSLDRWPNPDGPYAPGNVRWATQQEQVNNSRVARPNGICRNGHDTRVTGLYSMGRCKVCTRNAERARSRRTQTAA